LDSVAFASLVLLGHYHRRVNAALSWRPLVSLGIAGYGVYLVHQPIIQAVDWFGPSVLRGTIFIVPLAIAAGIAGGLVFHYIVERPCMDRNTWIRISPHLTPIFGWMDPWWQRLTGEQHEEQGVEEPIEI